MDELRASKKDEMLFFFKVDTRAKDFALRKRKFYQYMGLRFPNPKIRKIILHDPREPQGKFLVLKKVRRGAEREASAPGGSKWVRLDLNGKAVFRSFSSSIDNRDIFPELEDFLRTRPHLQNPFNIVTQQSWDYYANLILDDNSLTSAQREALLDRFDEAVAGLKAQSDPDLSSRLDRTLFFSSNSKKPLGKHFSGVGALHMTDVEMRNKYIHLINKNRDPHKLREYLEEYGFTRLQTTNDRKLDVFADADLTGAGNFIEDFLSGRRATRPDPSIESETVLSTPKVSQKLTDASVYQVLALSADEKPIILLLHDKEDPSQRSLLRRFERVAQEELEAPGGPRVSFMRMNIARNSFIPGLEPEAPALNFLRRKKDYRSPPVHHSNLHFETTLRALSECLGSSEQISAEEFFARSPREIPAPLRRARLN